MEESDVPSIPPPPLPPKQSIRLFHVNHQEDTYEIEFNDSIFSFIDLYDDFDHGYISISQIQSSKSNVLNSCQIGDVLISINDRCVINEDYEDVHEMIVMLHEAELSVRVKFLTISKCSFNTYIERTMIIPKGSNDLYGFHRSVDYLSLENQQRKLGSKSKTKLDMDWIAYLKMIGGPDNLKPVGIFKPNEQLKQLVRRGIPIAFRPLIWKKISLSSIHRLQFPSDYYKSLLLRVNSNELEPKVKNDIEKDLDRTFPEHEYFNLNGNGEASLRRILSAYALHNPIVGYCQSLNFICGMMLLLMDEEDVFWQLVTIVETLLPEDYYTRSMIGTYTDQQVLQKLIEIYLPNIHQRLEEAQLLLPLITVQWFMCIFVNTLRPEVVLRIWDIFFNEGSKVLFRIAIALFKIHESIIIETTDPGALFVKLRDLGKDVTDADALISIAYKDCSFVGFNSSTRKNITHARVSLPKNFPTGLGLAHLGPKSPFKDTDISEQMKMGLSSPVTTGESPQLHSKHVNTSTISVDTDPKVQIFSEYGLKLSILRENNSIDSKLPNGEVIHALVSDLPCSLLTSRKSQISKETNKNKIIDTSVDNKYREFKRIDILLHRKEYRIQMKDQFETMQAARQKWKEENDFEESGLAEGNEESPRSDKTIEDDGYQIISTPTQPPPMHPNLLNENEADETIDV